MISEWIKSSNSGADVVGPDGSGSQWAFPCAQALQKDCSLVSVWTSSIIFLDTNFQILLNPKCPSQQGILFMFIDFDFIKYVECLWGLWDCMIYTPPCPITALITSFPVGLVLTSAQSSSKIM